jgi:hypothetical protein
VKSRNAILAVTSSTYELGLWQGAMESHGFQRKLKELLCRSNILKQTAEDFIDCVCICVLLASTPD